ncbi:MAG: tripartite tricarboxylate transporter substrate binding protein, partial [Betaproteobacteria bacterium]|nr:tripartite tricarboxylate transporter substrate binding protein [Betaproteobacteria bacterium]
MPCPCTAVRASSLRPAAHLASAALLLGPALPWLLAAPAALAQASFPAKPIRIVVPAVPGGGTDILARLLTPRLAEIFGQSVVVENRGGAFTNIGTEFVARSPADGYTVLIASTPHAINPTLLSKLPFDPINDFTMISQLALTQNVLVVHPSLPVTSVKQFIALARARPGALTAGTSGGNSAYLAVEMLRSMAKIDIVNVAYKGAGQALNDTVAGHV